MLIFSFISKFSFSISSPEYEIVSPYEVNHRGVYISHEVSHHQRRRRRRSLTPDARKDSSNEMLHFRLSGLGQEFHMDLREASEGLIAPGFTIQVLGKNGTKSLRAYHQDDLCFYQGSLRSRVNSSVALSTCMGMVSLNVHRVGLHKGFKWDWGTWQFKLGTSSFDVHFYFNWTLLSFGLIMSSSSFICIAFSFKSRHLVRDKGNMKRAYERRQTRLQPSS